MESSLDAATTGEIRRQLAAAQAALTQLEALFAPIPAENAPAAPPKGGEE
jgi:hypothetical protein